MGGGEDQAVGVVDDTASEAGGGFDLNHRGQQGVGHGRYGLQYGIHRRSSPVLGHHGGYGSGVGLGAGGRVPEDQPAQGDTDQQRSHHHQCGSPASPLLVGRVGASGGGGYFRLDRRYPFRVV